MRGREGLPFGLDEKIEESLVTAHAGVPLVMELFRSCGAARQMDQVVVTKRRKRGLEPSELAEVAFVPAGSRSPQPQRYLAIRILKHQGSLCADGSERKHFAIVTNREGDGAELIRRHRGKAGTIEHIHHVLTNELAAEALPSQNFGANAAWLRLNALRYNLLSLLKRVGLPPEFHSARPKRLRFLLFNTIGRVIRHGCETLLRLTCALRRQLFDAVRLAIPPAPRLAGE
ncbi:MAG TPA: transposase [bacterium]